MRNDRLSLGSPTSSAWSPPRTSHETIPSQSSGSASQDYIGSATTIAWSTTMRSHETIPAPSAESVSQHRVSPAKIKKLNAQFLTAVKELDTFLIYKWVKDFSGQRILDTDHVQSALLALASNRNPEKSDFQRAAQKFRVLAVSAILDDKVASLECKDEYHKMTPLILAACFGRKAIVKLLVDNGASLRAIDGKLERNALSWAARNNWLETAEILLQASLVQQDREAVESRDIDRYAALDLARQNGHTRIVDLFVSRGAAIGELEAPLSGTLSWTT
jgi:hypothetical protein